MPSKEIEMVLQYEKSQGRSAVDVSRKYVGYDIKSSDRLIEVKKRSIKYGFVYLTENEFKTFLKNENEFLYLVYEGKDGELKLKILGRDLVLANTRFSRHFQLSLKKSVKESVEEISL
jgi:hypothetical protein